MSKFSDGQFKLRSALMKPIPGQDAQDSARRLARNAHRLGIATQEHRDLLEEQHRDLFRLSIPEAFVLDATPFDPAIHTRLVRGQQAEKLPFQGIAGVNIGLPEATPGFWDGNDGATKLWEIVACPVADIDAYYTTFGSVCLFGSYTGGGASAGGGEGGGLYNLINDNPGSGIESLFENTLIPMVTGLIEDLLGSGVLDALQTVVCAVIEVIEFIDAVVNEVKTFVEGTINDALEAIDGVVNTIDGVVTDIETAVGTVKRVVDDIDCVVCQIECLCACNRKCSRRRMEGISENVCSGHRSPCDESNELLCYNPVAEIDGVCLPKDTIDQLESSEIPAELVYELNVAMAARHIDEKADPHLLRGFDVAFGKSDGMSVVKIIMESLETTKTDLETSFSSRVGEAEKKFEQDIKNQCSRTQDTDEPIKKKRLRVDPSDLRKSQSFREATRQASAHGVDEGHIINLFDQLLNDVVDGPTLQSSIDFDKEFGAFFNDSDAKADIESKLQDLVVERKDEIVDQFLGAFVKEAFGKPEGRAETRTGLERRRLDSFENCQDNEIIGSIIQNAITTVVTDFLEGTGRLLGDDIVPGFLGVLDLFFKVMDPYSPNNPITIVAGFIRDRMNDLTKLFLFGNTDADLPSEGTIIQVQYSNADPTKMYLVSGCDGNFEGELIHTAYSIGIIRKLLDTILSLLPSVSIDVGASLGLEGTVGIEVDVFAYVAAPIKFALDVVEGLNSKLDTTCSYLDAYVEFVNGEAVVENTKWIMHELACNPTSSPRKGQGCDGLDNNCDAGNLIDECAEDVFPPEFQPLELPATFPTAENAKDYLLDNLFAVDDCLPVALTASIESQSEDSTSATILVTATADGCGDRATEDVTTETFVVTIADGTMPAVSACTFNPGPPPLSINMVNSYADAKLTIPDASDAASELKYTVNFLVNEMTTDTMVIVSDGPQPALFIQEFACPADNANCQVISGAEDRSRTYRVEYEVTDPTGNSATESCQLTIGDDYVEGPFFLVASTEFVRASAAIFP